MLSHYLNCATMMMLCPLMISLAVKFLSSFGTRNIYVEQWDGGLKYYNLSRRLVLFDVFEETDPIPVSDWSFWFNETEILIID